MSEFDWERPRLRPEISFSPGEVKGSRTVYYVNDRFTDQFYRIGEKEHFLLRRMDGRATLAELGREYESRFGRGLDERSWAGLFKMLEDRQMLEGRADEARLGELKELARENRRKEGRKPFSRRFHLFDPDALLTRLVPRVSFMFRPGVVAACLASIVAVEVWVLLNLGALREAVGHVSGQPFSWVLFVALVLLIAALHEMSHGAACKYYGGVVNEMGVMWRYLYFFPYCKLDHIILFQNRRHRVYVAAAGTYVGLLMLVPFAFVWWLAPPGSLVSGVSAKMLTFYNLLTLLNLVPFLKLDGYYMLAHALGMSELREESKKFLGKVAAHKLLGRGEGVGDYGRRERRLYWVFGVMSLLVTACVLTLVTSFWYRRAVGSFGSEHAWLVLGGVALLIVLRRWGFGLLMRLYRRWRPEGGAPGAAALAEGVGADSGGGAPPPASEPAASEAAAQADNPTTLGPARGGERVELLDVLRGFAVFGILLVNVLLFSAPTAFAHGGQWEGAADRLARGAIVLLAEGKFYAVFSFLFGLGLVMQAERAASRGTRFAPLYLRRLAVLLLIGLIHAYLIWWGDILHIYALIGGWLLLFRKREPKTILIWAGALVLIPVLVLTITGAAGMIARAGQIAPRPAAAGVRQARAAQAAEAVRVYTEGSYGEMVRQRVNELVREYSRMGLYAPHFLALFLLGLYAGRRGIFSDPEAHVALIRRVAWVGLGVGGCGSLLYALTVEVSSRGVPIPFGFMPGALNFVTAPALGFGYAAALTLLYRREVWRARLSPLAAVGRMALTNYLLQTLIGTTIFYGYGLGLYGRVGPALCLAIAVGVFLVQIPLSVWWLGRFRFGPAEWAWRSLTYLKPQPLLAGRDFALTPAERAKP